jgi:hypothetical protein
MDEGAVYQPLCVTLPVPAGVTVQTTAWFAVLSTVAANCCDSPGYTVALNGLTWTAIANCTVTVAEALFDGSATLVAVIVTVGCAGDDGAVYRPAAVMVPMPDGLRDHVTAVLPAFVTVAENCWVPPAGTDTAVGATVTPGEASVITAEADLVASATLVAFTKTVCPAGVAGAV